MLGKRLKKGDKIGIISPSSILKDIEDIEILEKTIKIFEKIGYKVEKGKYYLTDETGYGTTAKHKSDDIMQMFKDNEIKAIFSITGGNNCISVDEYLDYEIIKNNPKIFCGFSDTTSLLNLLNKKANLITFMGPSFKSISSGETDYRLKSVIDRFIENKNNLAYSEDINEFEIIRKGKAIGETIGGNLSLTTDLISGKNHLDFNNKILLIEELSYESEPEKVSHDLYKMKQEGIFQKILGIWIGNYENEIQIDKILLDTIDDIEFDKPIIKSNNFGHGEKKIIIPIGVKIEINTKMNKPYVKMIDKFLEE